MRNENLAEDLDKSSTAHSPAPERTGSRAADVGVSAVLGGAAAGAVAGTLAGPVGAAVGAVVGAVAAGFAGNAIAASIDKDSEEAYWRESYGERPYVDADASFDDYGPAYTHGVTGFVKHPGRSFEDAESDLSRDWTASRGTSNLDWNRAKHASRDAWQRVSDAVERAVPGDSDRDGR